MIGTKNKKSKENKKIIGDILYSFLSSIEDRTKIINIPKKTKQ